MKDVANQTLEVGDRVAFIPQNGYTSQLSIGIIEGFTPQKIKIVVTNKAWQYSDDRCLKFPEQVCKIQNQNSNKEEQNEIKTN